MIFEHFSTKFDKISLVEVNRVTQSFENHGLVGLHFRGFKISHNHIRPNIFDIIHPATSCYEPIG